MKKTATILLISFMSAQVFAGKKAKKVTTTPEVLKIELMYEKPNQQQVELAKGDGREAISSIHVKLNNPSDKNQIFCEQPILDTLSWFLSTSSGEVLPNANRGHDIDYDYSRKLSEGDCHIIEPHSSFVFGERALIEKDGKQYWLRVSFLCAYGPLNEGTYKLTLSASNRAALTSFPEEKDLVKSLIAKSKTGTPTNVKALLEIAIPNK